jgi:hypothetical protein
MVSKFLVNRLDCGRIFIQVCQEWTISHAGSAEDIRKKLRRASSVMWSSKEVYGVEPFAKVSERRIVLCKQIRLFRVLASKYSSPMQAGF